MLNRGSAAHGDYVFGWQGDTLQKAMDNGCNLNTDCSKAGIHAQTSAQYSACKVQQQAPETVDGCKSFSPACSCKYLFLYREEMLMPFINRAQGYAHGRNVGHGLECSSF